MDQSTESAGAGAVNYEYIDSLASMVKRAIAEYESHTGRNPVLIQVHPTTKNYIDRTAGVRVDCLCGIPLFPDTRVQPECMVLPDA